MTTSWDTIAFIIYGIGMVVFIILSIFLLMIDKDFFKRGYEVLVFILFWPAVVIGVIILYIRDIIMKIGKCFKVKS